jgi:transcriptional regulator with XRE-family HTH domain
MKPFDNYVILWSSCMQVGDMLRERRLELGKTQEQVARDAGMNVTQYNGYERGRSMPSSVTLPRLAKALQTTSEALLRLGPGRSDHSESRRDVIRRLRDQFRAQVAAELDLSPDDVNIRVEIL